MNETIRIRMVYGCREDNIFINEAGYTTPFTQRARKPARNQRHQQPGRLSVSPNVEALREKKGVESDLFAGRRHHRRGPAASSITRSVVGPGS